MQGSARRAVARRAAVISVGLVVLALPAQALASAFFKGPVGGGAGNAGVEFRVNIHNGHANKVLEFRWFNIPVPPNCAVSFEGTHFAMNVNDRQRFHGTYSVPNANYKAIVRGRFKHHAKKATGTLKLKGSFVGGCADTETDALSWTAKRPGG